MTSSRAILLVVALVAIFVRPVAGQAQFVLYDDFALSQIDEEKWRGDERSLGGRNTETTRRIAAKKLNLLLTTFGNASSDSGASTGRQFLFFANPAPITAIQATVTIEKRGMSVEGCPENPTSTRARASILGFFFNDGTSPAAGDATGNVFAIIEKTMDSALGNTIRAGFGRCLSNDCTFAPFLLSETFVASWAAGKRNTLRLEWDQLNNQFVFTLNPGAPGQEIVVLPYALSDTTPLQRFDQKDLRVTNTVANCTAGRRKATTSAFFDDVMTNP